MCAAPNLVEFTLDGVDCDVYCANDVDWTGPFTHTSLRHLYLGKGERITTAAILSYLTLPALQTLHISNFDIPHHAALSFLTRSSPPLQLLCMATPLMGWSAQSISSYFRLLPGLTDLELRCGSYSEDAIPFLRVLATSDNFLPNLCNLTIRDLFLDRTGYKNLIRVLSDRRTSSRSKIQAFRLDHNRADEINGDIVVALRQLVADGMDIHISTRDTRLF
ncbi:hypothetical protein DFH09DRAFT_1367795 [Mycena vulgaris]|nr:hypothetical protein DFH09DRAFT_1367795 [Mycena vulgaris]